MKQLIISIFLIFYCFISCKQKDKSKTVNKELYTVYKIDSINSYYLIYLKKSYKNFKVISKKETVGSCNKISINDQLDISLTSILSQEYTLGNQKITNGNNALVNCYYFGEDTFICKESDNRIYDLHSSENIIGLCLKH